MYSGEWHWSQGLSCYLRGFSESRSSSGSSPSVLLSVRLSTTLCVICNSKSFHSFLFKLCKMIVHTLNMCTSYFVHISSFFLALWLFKHWTFVHPIFYANVRLYFWVLKLDVELRHYYVYTTFGVLSLCYLCVNRFHSYMGRDARKPVFMGLRITQAQTSLHIRAVWSAPSLFAFWKISYVNLLPVKFEFSS